MFAMETRFGKLRAIQTDYLLTNIPVMFQISLPLEKRRNATSLYNPMTIAELQQKFPK